MAYDESLAERIRELALDESPMNGWLHIDSEQLDSDETLSEWLSVGIDFATSLPPK